MSFQGWFTFISEPFAKFLFFLMKLFYQVTHSWGFSIIFLTVALRAMLYPLNTWSIKSSLRMQQIAPKIKALQEKHKKDPKKAQMEVLSLYREAGVNPMTGCLPILIQIPFLIGMFDLLKSVFELRGACFIPGWITNLTAPDIIFSWDYPIPFFGTSFHLLPFLLAGVMFIQQRMSAQGPKDPAQMTDTQKQQRMMGNIMTQYLLDFFNGDRYFTTKLAS
jgi:YidC/Oxa1 family membrane protein insertase